MFGHGKTIGTWASVAMLAGLGLTLSSDALAESERVMARTNPHIEACVMEISKKADYSNATRVVHEVDWLNQKNLIELEIGITTSVFYGDDDTTVRIYRTACTTGNLADVIKVRVTESLATTERQG